MVIFLLWSYFLYSTSKRDLKKITKMRGRLLSKVQVVKLLKRMKTKYWRIDVEVCLLK